MADVNKTVAVIFQGEDQTKGALASVEKSLSGIGGEAKTAESNLQKVGYQVEDLGGKGEGLEALVTGLKALGAGLVVSAFIDANVEAEKFQKTMVILTGSNEAAAREFEYVRDVSNRLGIELFATGNAYAQLAASTRGTTLEGQATRDIFEAVAKAMGSLGKSSADTEGALLAISQIVSKGTVSLEELRGQLGERLPGAFQIAASSMGLTTKELDKLVSSGNLTADEFLPKFAAALDKAFDGATFDGYTNSLARLQNAISDAFIQIGNAGVFDIFIKGIQAGTASLVGIQAGIVLLGETFANLAFSLANGDFSGFGERLDASLKKAADATRGARDALLGAEDATKKVGEAGELAGVKLDDGFKKAALSADQFRAKSAELDKSLKALGIDPKIFQDPIKDIEKAFTDLANNPALTGDKFLAGLVGALRALPEDASLETFRQQVAFAFRDGRISVEELNQALALLDVKQKGLAPSFSPATDAVKSQADALKKQADAAKKSEEASAKMALELEKLASNERIKSIEARVKLNVAEVEADTKRIEAAFQSINVGIQSTGDVIGKLFALFGNEENLSLRALSDLREQIDIENKFRQQSFDLQKQLTEAQIEQIRARTQAMQRGDAMIKVDGAGLQPELEAFMWKILRAVQVRVNQQGLEMLLGT